MRKYIPAGLIILLFTFLNVLAFLTGLIRTPPGSVFTGAVQYSPDYYFYLSYISQGTSRWVSAFHLFTGETATPTLIGWFYTLSGRLLLPLDLSPAAIFVLLTVALSALYLTIAYVFLIKLFPGARLLSIPAFILFLTSNTLPRFLWQQGRLNITDNPAWYNFGNPFERLTYIPHHLLFEGAAVAALMITADWWRDYTHSSRTGILLVLIGLLLSSLQPALWMVIVIAIAIGALWKPKNIYKAIYPAIIVGISGLPFALYLKYYVYTLPFFKNQLTVEPSWQVATTPMDYFFLNGPLVVTAILGLPLWLSRQTRQKIALTAAAAVSLILFFSPVGPMLQILDIRFLSVIPTLFYAAVTVNWIKNKSLLAIVVSILVLLSVPLMAQELEDRNSLFIPTNDIVYPSTPEILAFKKAAAISTTDDVFLLPTPFDTLFSGLTGRRVFIYQAVPYWTIDFEKKRSALNTFYYGHETDTAKRDFLKKYHITYVIDLSSAPSPYGPLRNVYSNDYMIVYKVLQ